MPAMHAVHESSGPAGSGISINLRKFDPSKIGDARTCMIIGKRNTGKSVLTKDIMFHKRHIPVGMVMSRTEVGNGWYTRFVPPSFVYHAFDAKKVDAMIERQRKLCERNKRERGGKPPTKTFLVLDDCMFDKKVMREKCIRELFFNGRHFGIFFVTTAQYVADAGPEIRSNCDYVFVMKENLRTNRERLWKWFFGIFPTFPAFEAAMDACTNDYGCLVLDNTSQSNRIEDNVFWYKAEVRDNFRMGSPLAWAYHRQSRARRAESAKDASARTSTGSVGKDGKGVSVRVVKQGAARPRPGDARPRTSAPAAG